ncbi:hypothetical protein ACQP3J_29605, partial [Escherichia coli]
AFGRKTQQCVFWCLLFFACCSVLVDEVSVLQSFSPNKHTEAFINYKLFPDGLGFLLVALY